MATDQEDQGTGFDPKRRLCPDGACIGVIAADGKCTVCGMGDDGSPQPDPEAAEPPDQDELPSEIEQEVADGDRPASGSSFDPKRRLCSDGTCIGVIGSNNRCSVCGKPANT